MHPRKVLLLEKGHHLQRQGRLRSEPRAPGGLISQVEARDLALAKSYGQSHALGILWRVKGARGAPPSPAGHQERTGARPGSLCRGASRVGEPGWKEGGTPRSGGAHRGPLLAVGSGKLSVVRVVAPQVSLQAVGETPVTGAELLLTHGPGLCKQDTRGTVRKGRYALPTPPPGWLRSGLASRLSARPVCFLLRWGAQ